MKMIKIKSIEVFKIDLPLKEEIIVGLMVIQ